MWLEGATEGEVWLPDGAPDVLGGLFPAVALVDVALVVEEAVRRAVMAAGRLNHDAQVLLAALNGVDVRSLTGCEQAGETVLAILSLVRVECWDELSQGFLKGCAADFGVCVGDGHVSGSRLAFR